MAQVRVVSLFLASPGDLEEERRASREIVDDLNHTLGKEAGIFLSLMGWEDTLPGAGRPQQLINSDVEACEIFVGMIWKRWGTPSGEYSSGFEEEYQIAVGRRVDSHLPDIWLAFKTVDPAQLADPGEQLQKVISFKEAVRSSRQVLYKEFASVEDWATKFRSWLSTLLIRMIKDQAREAKGDDRSAIITPAEGDVAALERDSAQPAILPPALVEAAKQLGRAATSESLEGYQAALVELPDDAIARLFLSLKSVLADRMTADVLATHEINVLYRKRSSVELIASENDLIFRGLLADADSTYPAWYWFQSVTLEDTRAYVIHIATFDPDSRVRSGASKFLLALGIAPPVSAELEQFASSSFVEGRRGVISWLAEMGNPEHEPLLQTIADRDARFADDIKTALLRIELRNGNNAVLQSLLDSQKPASPLFLEVKAALVTLSSLELEPYANAGASWLRMLATKILSERGELSAEKARVLLGDSVTPMRQLAATRLAMLGEMTDRSAIRELFAAPQPRVFTGWANSEDRIDVEQPIRSALSHLSEADLADAVDWLSLDGPIAYRLLVQNHFEEQNAVALSDIASGFDRIRAHSFDQIERSHSAEVRRQVEEKFSEHTDYIQARFLVAALTAFKDKAPHQVLGEARRLLSTPPEELTQDFVAVAADIVAAAGDSSDLLVLLDRVDKSYAPGRPALISAIIVHSKSEQDTLLALSSTDPDLVCAVLESIDTDRVASLQGRLVELLHAEDIRIRQATVLVLTRALPLEGAAAILDAYLDSRRYFYNAVAWFDRLLFAPPFLLSKFQQNAASSIKP